MCVCILENRFHSRFFRALTTDLSGFRYFFLGSSILGVVAFENYVLIINSRYNEVYFNLDVKMCAKFVKINDKTILDLFFSNFLSKQLTVFVVDYPLLYI